MSIDDLLAKIGKIAKQGEVDEFRRMLRTRIVDEVLGVQDPEKRVEALLDMINVQPESASRGHLFGEFRQKLMNADPRDVMKAAGKKPARFYEPGFKATRQPDDVIEVASGSDIPSGTWLGEDKAGKGAFDIDQLIERSLEALGSENRWVQASSERRGCGIPGRDLLFLRRAVG